MLNKLKLKTTSDHNGKRLDQILAEWLPTALSRPVSKAKARKLIVAGAVYLNRKRVRIASKNIFKGAEIEAWVDVEKLFSDNPSTDVPFSMTNENILYEDAHLIAINKPSGLPTQPALEEARSNLFTAVKKFLAEREHTTDPYLGLHHRLDRDTSGIVLFTKTKLANPGLANSFLLHQVQKIYHALTSLPVNGAEIPDEWIVRNSLGKSRREMGKGVYMHSVPSGGQDAHSEFRLIKRLSKGFHVEAMPKTGRMHQIRVHLSEYGIPVLGDRLYSHQSGTVPRLMLHACRIELPHPVSGEMLTIESPFPKDFLDCLDALK